MADDKIHPADSQRETAVTGSGEYRKGAQVVQTNGLPEGYIPPSAALTPTSNDTAAQPSDSDGNSPNQDD